MAHNKDVIPARDADFDGWLNNLTAYIDAKITSGAWTHIPAAKVTELKQHNTDWHAAHVKTLGPHTNVDIKAKNDAREAAEGFVRPFIQQYLKYDPVSDEDRTAMNLHNRDSSQSHIGPHTTRALITSIKALGGFQVELRFQDEAAPGSHAVPYGCNGCLANYTWGPDKITDYAALTQTRLMTHTPFVITLPTEAEASFFSCAVRWQSRTGELGPWGEIQHIVIV